MTDPIATLTKLLEPIFSEMNGGDPADPVVRPSDRADAQINGALALAKKVGANPRDLAESVTESAALTDVASSLEVAGPGFINVEFSQPFLESLLAGSQTTIVSAWLPPPT